MAAGSHAISRRLIAQVEAIQRSNRGDMALDRIIPLLRLSLMRREPSAIIALADRARDARRWELAARLYREALDQNPHNPPIWVQYGHALKESGGLRDPDKLAQAELAYRRALSLDLGASDTYLQLGHVLKLQSKTEEAQAAYLRAFALDPTMLDPLHELEGLGWSEAQLSELRELALLDDPSPASCDALAYQRRHPEAAAAGGNLHFLCHRTVENGELGAEREGTSGLEDLPWRYNGPPTLPVRGHFRVLFVVHCTNRTGAPICTLRLLEQLVHRPDLDCRVLVNDDGELTPSFAKLWPTLQLDDVCHTGIGRAQAIAQVAQQFRDDSTRCVAVVHTVSLAHYAEAFDRCGVPVLAWVQELPTSIEAFYDGARTMARIDKASRRILCPSEFVREAIAAAYGVDRQKLVTIRNGAQLPPAERDDAATRRGVRAELDLPADAKIILGCGTVDARKGADLFVRAAHALLNTDANRRVDTWFVWVGNPWDQPFMHWLHHDAQRLGISDRVIFTGPRVEPAPYYAAADLFLLTSREDPFPLVIMEALSHGLTVIAFEGGGGAIEILGEGRGVVVPYLDTVSMAEAAGRLLADLPATRGRSRKIAEFIALKHSWATYAQQFIGLLNDSFDYVPSKHLKVSVIIPNYNHAPYLPQRIESILAQTRLPDEIVFVDDASEDESVEIARRCAASSPVPFRVVPNDRNSGSTFKQWLRGFSMVSADLVWIAESDDWCEPDFLERMVPEFYDESVHLAFSQSAIVGPDGEFFAPNYLDYTDEISKTHWRSWYSIPAEDEIILALSQKNTIPNASGVVFRRPEIDSVQCKLKEYRLCGDWWFYTHAIRNGKISFVPQVLNYHRRHGQTVTHSIEKEDGAIEEALAVKQELFTTYPVPVNAKCRSIASTVHEYYRLSELHGLERPDLHDKPALARQLAALRANIHGGGPDGRLRILTVLPDAEVGGGQIAGIRLANMIARTHHSFLLNARPDRFDPDVASLVDERVVLLEGTLGPTGWSAHRGDGPHLNQLAEGEQRLRLLRELIRFHRVDAILSHVWWADRLTYAVVRELGIPWLLCMHGCYEGLVDHPDWDPEFEGIVRPLFRAAAGVIHSTTRNLSIFDRFGIEKPPVIVRLFHGFDPAEVPNLRGHSLRRGSDEFVFCLCSRAIPEKGWQEAIEAVLSINALPASERGGVRARLVLIGGGPYAETLAATFGAREEIEFRGQLSRVVELVAQCDAGLLPSRFVSESLPSTIIEYLACGIPVVTTDHGAIAEMVAVDGRDAGLVLPLHGILSFESLDLAALMLRYMTNPVLYAEHKANARYVFERLFDANYVAEQFLEVIRSIIATAKAAKSLRARAE
jgi:glycosyltransferase involved in cell wall biosynthesis